MRYKKPNFREEWREALRYREFEKMGMKGWLDVAQNDFKISFQAYTIVMLTIHFFYLIIK